MLLTRKLKNLAEEYRKGIAEALGVPPEYIRQDVVEKWVREWARAFLVPEAFRQMFGHASPTYVELATKELMSHVLDVFVKKDLVEAGGGEKVKKVREEVRGL